MKSLIKHLVASLARPPRANPASRVLVQPSTESPLARPDNAAQKLFSILGKKNDQNNIFTIDL